MPFPGTLGINASPTKHAIVIDMIAMKIAFRNFCKVNRYQRIQIYRIFIITGK